MGISHSLLVGIKDGAVTLDGILTISCKSENMPSAQVQGLMSHPYSSMEIKKLG